MLSMTFQFALLAVAIVAVCVLLIEKNGSLLGRPKKVKNSTSKFRVKFVPTTEPQVENVTLSLVTGVHLIRSNLMLNETQKFKNVLHDIVKPPLDKREYRTLELANKIKVILISDPTTDKAAAALTVMAGSLHNPKELPGLAHYLEHLLFLGTKKFPQENAYFKYLTMNGGTANAYTANDHTGYYFSIAPEGFKGALDRFSQFFISPLFAPEWSEREVNAVDSEHQGTLIHDSWRLERVNRFLSKPEHPYSLFITGNKETLWNRPLKNSIDIRSELIKFFESHYSANLMSLVVLGQENLDQLEKLVGEYFGSISNKNLQLTQFESPWGVEELETRIDIVPIKDVRQLVLYFPIPDYTAHYKSGALAYVELLIQHRGPGSLLSLLKKLKWVNHLMVESQIPARGFGFIQIKIDLTPQGLQNCNDVILHIFQYFEMVRKEGVKKWFWLEIKSMRETQFKFKEKESAENVVMHLASQMPYYPLDQVWTSNYLLSDYQPKLIDKLVSYLVPSNVRVVTQTKENQKNATIKEEFMNVQFSYYKIEKNIIQKWTNCGLNVELKFPPVNEFVPRDLNLKPRVNYTGSIPLIVSDDEMSRMWFLQDQEFLVPRASIMLTIKTPQRHQSLRWRIIRNFMTHMVKDLLTESTYMASQTDLEYILQSEPTGIDLQVGGYNDKLSLFFEQILKSLVNFHTSAHQNPNEIQTTFDNIKEIYIRYLKNMEDKSAQVQAYHYLNLLLDSHSSSYDDILAAVMDVSLDDVMTYSKLMFQNVRLEWLIYGNVDLTEALELHEKTKEHFRLIGATPLEPIQVPLTSTQIKLPNGSNFLFKKELRSQSESAVVIFFQSEMKELRREFVILLVLHQIMKENCFNTLRTKEQLGYSVFCVATKTAKGFPAYSISIQGSHHPAYAESRVDLFLQQMAMSINNLTQDELMINKNAVMTELKAGKSKMLIYRAHFLNLQIALGTFDFDGHHQILKHLHEITLNQVQNYFNTWISPVSTQRRVLTVHVISKAQKSFASMGPNLKTTHKEIGQINEWKTHLGYYDPPKPLMDIPPWKLGLRVNARTRTIIKLI